MESQLATFTSRCTNAGGELRAEGEIEINRGRVCLTERPGEGWRRKKGVPEMD